MPCLVLHLDYYSCRKLHGNSVNHAMPGFHSRAQRMNQTEGHAAYHMVRLSRPYCAVAHSPLPTRTCYKEAGLSVKLAAGNGAHVIVESSCIRDVKEPARSYLEVFMYQCLDISIHEHIKASVHQHINNT